MFSPLVLAQLANLTPDQQEAIATLVKNQKNRVFIGTSPEMMISDFANINILQKTEPIRAKENETALIAACNRNPL